MTKLYPYQNEGVEILEQYDGRVLLADEQGLGKTIQVLQYMKNHPEIRPAIVICPAVVKWVWELQAFQHYGLRVCVLSGRKPPKTGLPRNANILILNYDILAAWKDYLIALQPQVVAMDEVQAIKSLKTQRAKACKSLCKNVPHVIAISGTPLTNRPMELFSTLNILYPKEFPHFWTYAQKFCHPRRTPWGWNFNGASHLDELHRKLKKLGMIRRLKKDVLKDLPDKTRIVAPVDIENRKEYNRVLTDFIEWLGEQSPAKAKRARKAEELVKMGYLIRLAAESKMKAVYEWIDNFLESTDEKLVVFCVHKKIVRLLRERYKDISVKITGETSQPNRKQAVLNFQKNKKTRLFIGNIRAAGVGIDLWAASNVVFIETGWVPAEVLQAVDRLHRIGQTKHVFVHFLVARETIEEQLCEIIERKQKIVTHVLDGRQAYRKETIMDVYQELLKTVAKGK